MDYDLLTLEDLADEVAKFLNTSSADRDEAEHELNELATITGVQLS